MPQSCRCPTRGACNDHRRPSAVCDRGAAPSLPYPNCWRWRHVSTAAPGPLCASSHIDRRSQNRKHGPAYDCSAGRRPAGDPIGGHHRRHAHCPPPRSSHCMSLWHSVDHPVFRYHHFQVKSATDIPLLHEVGEKINCREKYILLYAYIIAFKHCQNIYNI